MQIVHGASVLAPIMYVHVLYTLLQANMKPGGLLSRQVWRNGWQPRSFKSRDCGRHALPTTRIWRSLLASLLQSRYDSLRMIAVRHNWQVHSSDLDSFSNHPDLLIRSFWSCGVAIWHTDCCLAELRCSRPPGSSAERQPYLLQALHGTAEKRRSVHVAGISSIKYG